MRDRARKLIRCKPLDHHKQHDQHDSIDLLDDVHGSYFARNCDHDRHLWTELHLPGPHHGRSDAHAKQSTCVRGSNPVHDPAR